MNHAEGATGQAPAPTCSGRTCLLAVILAVAGLGTVAAADSSTPSDEGGMEEVVVTAQRRDQNLMAVPLAVTAVSGDELDKLGALDLLYLGQVTPNATIEIARGTNNALAAYIRGVGQQDHIAGFETGVGLYVDDVSFNRPQMAVLQIYDVERIEVLRGPQGTLYGRNTVGGAIKYVTRKLAAEPGLTLRGRAGSYGMRDAIATASLPLGDSLRVGGTLATFNEDGFGENLFLPGVGNYDEDVKAARASAEWRPADNVFVRLAADWQQDDSHLRRGHRVMVGGYSGAPILDDVYDTRAGNLVPEADASASGVSLLVEWNGSDRVTWRAIFASRADDTWKPTDLDSLPTVDVDVSTWDRNRQRTAELQSVFDSGRWSGVAGLFLLDARAATRLEAVLGTTGDFIGRPGLNNQLVSFVDTRNWAAYADLSYSFSERWSASLGARYTHDKRSVDILRQIVVGGLSDFFGGNGIVASTPSDFESSAVFEEVTPRVTLQWQPGIDQNLYLSYSEGFKGGGFDPRGLTSLAPDFDGDGSVSTDEVDRFMKFDPEQVSSWEAGWKATLLGGRLSSRLAVFRADYTDVQIPGSVEVDANGDGIAEQYVGVTTNAADADIRGIEWEGSVMAAEDLGAVDSRLVVSWALGLIDAKFNEFVDSTGEDVAWDSAFANTPDWTAAVTASYGLPVVWFRRRGDLTLITTLSARGEEVQFYNRDPLMDQGAYALWDLSAVWSDSGERWQLGVHGKNLTDKRYIVSGLDITLGLEGNTTIFFGNPRQYWLDLQYRFN